MNQDIDQKFMSLALQEAEKARLVDEVPIGAVIVDKNCRIISKGYNLKEATNDPTAHAELLVIREASKKLNDWRLEGATLYVTLEPCVMCMGAIINARVKRVVFGATDEKGGCVVSNYKIGLNSGYLNHKIEFTQGVLEAQCGKVLREFFKGLR